ncbi:hypothetical protein [Vibrio parahaemolyticus]|uniref:hypothetical protein n=1 Tax=Vibrio parahaemolyticus TaxID=670 RepID=UPI0005F12AA5|nr:hypothetical protein [Vibrio parahaemolyticus]KJR27819.1 hypothetical protein UF30_03560 [Vibrio parahaemolyticus]
MADSPDRKEQHAEAPPEAKSKKTQHPPPPKKKKKTPPKKRKKRGSLPRGGFLFFKKGEKKKKKKKVGKAVPPRLSMVEKIVFPIKIVPANAHLNTWKFKNFVGVGRGFKSPK